MCQRRLLLFSAFFWITTVAAFSDSGGPNPVFKQSSSPDGRFKLTVSAAEIDITHGSESQIISSGEVDFASEKGELGKIEWSENSRFFLITTQAGAHSQYTAQNLYQLDEIGAASHRAWSFHEVTLLQRLGEFALVDPDRNNDEEWAVCSIKLAGPLIDVELAPAGRNSHEFDSDSECFYKLEVAPTGDGFSIKTIIREPGESSKEPAKVIWRRS